MKIQAHKFRTVLIIILINLLISPTILAQINKSTKKVEVKQIKEKEPLDSINKTESVQKHIKQNKSSRVIKEDETSNVKETGTEEKKRKREHVTNQSSQIYPNKFKHIATYPKDGHLGSDVHSEGIQGLAHSPTNWYWTRASWKVTYEGKREESYIYKMGANHMSRRVKVEGVPGEIWRMGWHHLSDPDYYKGYLYVPIEKGSNDWTGDHDVPDRSLPPLIMIYDEDLNFLDSAPLSFHKDGKDYYSGGAWCAINPVNGLLYVSRGTGKSSEGNYSILDVYDPILDVGAETQTSIFRLFYRYSVKLHFREPFTDTKTYIQGGVFSPDGLFYYVMDPKNDSKIGGSKHHSQQGVHVFEINGEIGTEIIVKGKIYTDPESNIEREEEANHIRRVYERPRELEGLDFVSPNESIYKVLMNNMREIDVPSLINETEGTTTGFLLLIELNNILGSEDAVNLFHYQLINHR